jgi:hypothetical protein
VTALPTSAPLRTAPVVATAVVVSAGLLLGGCSFTSRDLTLEPYAPSDGLQADLGDVLVRNVLVVSEGDGEPGVLSATLANRGDEDRTLLVEVGESTAEEPAPVTQVEVPAQGTLVIGVEGQESAAEGAEIEVVVVDAVEELAGGVIRVSFEDPEEDSATLEVPIVRPEGPYAGLTPPTS